MNTDTNQARKIYVITNQFGDFFNKFSIMRQFACFHPSFVNAQLFTSTANAQSTIDYYSDQGYHHAGITFSIKEINYTVSPYNPSTNSHQEQESSPTQETKNFVIRVTSVPIGSTTYLQNHNYTTRHAKDATRFTEQEANTLVSMLNLVYNSTYAVEQINSNTTPAPAGSTKLYNINRFGSAANSDYWLSVSSIPPGASNYTAAHLFTRTKNNAKSFPLDRAHELVEHLKKIGFDCAGAVEAD